MNASTSPTAGQPPYKGLRPYEEQDRDNFFGREAECRILIDKILANKLTLLFAASGVGKSSLLQAAVLPRLKDPRHENRDGVYYNDWVSPPLDGLKQQVFKTLQQLNLLENMALPAELREQSLNEFFGFCALFTRQPLVVVLDQFEEFFQYQRHTTDFKPFIQQLSAAVTDRDTPIAVVIAMREDFALELNAFKPTLPTLLFENFYRLERLDKANARKAIEEPVRHVGFRFEPALLEALLKNLAAREQRGLSTIPVAEELDTVEPAYLQIVCSQLWEAEQHNPDRSLRLQTYQAKGRAEGILKNYVESIIGGFSPGDKKLASKAFDHLITRRGTKMAYTAGDLAQLLGVNGEALGKVLDRLEVSRILRQQSRQGVFWYELYHDLFSRPIEEWNEVYKTKQRNRRAFILAVIGVIVGLALYGAYDVAINYTSFHLRLSVKTGLSDKIDLYQGKPESLDILGLQAFLIESGYERSQIEPDKLFDKKPIGNYKQLNMELIGNLPLIDRIQAYWEDGQTERALDLARNSISENDLNRSQEVIDIIVKFHSSQVFSILETILEKSKEIQLKKIIVNALSTIHHFEVDKLLLKAQKDKDPRIRTVAVNAIGRLSIKRSMETLLVRLNDEDKNVRSAAVEALRQIADHQAVEPLLARLNDEDEGVRSVAAIALGHLGDNRAVEPLLARLNDEESRVQTSVAEALGMLGGGQSTKTLLEWLIDVNYNEGPWSWKNLLDLTVARYPQAVELILARLNDKNYLVRLRAVEALGWSGDTRAVEPLLARLADERDEVSWAAADALEQLGERQITKAWFLAKFNDKATWKYHRPAEMLIRLTNNTALELLVARLSDKNDQIRSSAVEALGQLRNPQAVEPLLTLLSDKNLQVRASVAKAMVEIGSNAVEPLLKRLSDQYLEIRQEVVAILGEIGDRRAVELLVKQLNNLDIKVRWGAAKSLAQLGDNRAVEPLLAGLTDGDGEVRGDAAKALAQLGDNRAVEPLLKRLSDQDSQDNWKHEETVNTAVEALGWLEDHRAVEPLLTFLSYSSTDGYNYSRTEKVAKVLGRLGDRRAVEPLLALLNNKKADTGSGGGTYAGARANAAAALGRLGGHQALEPLIVRLDDKYEEPEVRSSAATALGQLGNHQGLEILLAHLNDYNEDVRFAVLLAAARLGGDKIRDEVIAIFSNPKEKPKVKLAAAAALVTFQQKDGWEMLKAFSQSERIPERQQVAEVLGNLPTANGSELLRKLLQDNNIDIRLSAIQSLGDPEHIAALPDLHALLNNDDVRIQKETAEALAKIASPDSVTPLKIAVFNSQISLPARLLALEGLGRIGTDNATQVILWVLQSDKLEPALQMRASKLLGNLKLRRALPELSDRLEKLDEQYRRWRTIRDAERANFSKEEAEKWAKKLTDAQPQAYWAYILGYNMARIDPEKTGIKLLSHNLADVRSGAWEGIGQVGTAKLLKQLYQERQQTKDSLFRHAAYRAIDLLLIRLGGSRNPQDRTDLEAFYRQVKDEEGVGERVEWTLNQLKERFP